MKSEKTKSDVAFVPELEGKDVEIIVIPENPPITHPELARGPRGKDGRDGKDGAPGVGFTWRGAWANTNDYKPNDVVGHDGSSWIATAETSEEPSATAKYWGLMAASARFRR